MRPTRPLIALLGIAALTLSACGNDSGSAEDDAGGASTVDVEPGDELDYGDTARLTGVLEARGGVEYELELTVAEPVAATEDELAALIESGGGSVGEDDGATFVRFTATLVSIDDEAEIDFLPTLAGNGVAARGADGEDSSPLPLDAGEDDYPPCPPTETDLSAAEVGVELEFCLVQVQRLDDGSDVVEAVRYHELGTSVDAEPADAVVWS